MRVNFHSGLTLLRRGAIAVLASAGMVGTAQAAAFATCPTDMFLSQAPNGNSNTTLYNVNTSTNPFTFPAQGTIASVNYNAIGFNPNDSYLYAIQQNSNVLLQIGDNGQAVSLGAVDQLPTGVNFLAGEISSNGTYYVIARNSNTLYVIDIATRHATTRTLTQSVDSLDLAWSNGLLYSLTPANDQLFSINVTSGQVTTIGSGGGNVSYGALFGTPTGVYANANDGSGFYRVNLGNGTLTLLSSSPGAQLNDGAHCVNAEVALGSEISVTKTDGTNVTSYLPGNPVTYTVVVSNAGPFTAQSITVSDPMPTGITSASWTCAASNGSTCGGSGSGSLTDTVTLLSGGTATYTIVMQVPANRTGNLVNTASVTLPATVKDTNTSNNSATDTDTQARAQLAVTKTNTPTSGASDLANDTVTRGLPTTYTIVVTNNGPQAANGAIVTDPAVTGLTCTRADCTGTTGSATCPTQANGAALLTALQGTGAAIPALPNASTVTLTVTCTVN